jgi:hypothetical protein
MSGNSTVPSASRAATGVSSRVAVTRTGRSGPRSTGISASAFAAGRRLVPARELDEL